MTRGSRTERSDDATIVVKEATGDAVDALRAEGERLAAAAHPGVIRVVSSTGDDACWQLRTVHAGRPLDVGPALDARSLAGVAAATATTLADLHQMGIVHGRLKASHILIGQSGRPVLCGLGPDDGGCEPCDDVGALGQVIIDRLADEQVSEPIPERRWSRRRRWDGWARSALLNLAEQACTDPPSRRPSARRFAAAISTTFEVAEPLGQVATATAPAADDVQKPHDPIEVLRQTIAEPPRTVRPLPLRAMAGVVSVVLGCALVVHSSMERTATSVQPATTTISSQPTPRPAAPVTVESPRPHRCPGSGCPTDDDVLVQGTVVTTSAGRFQVGRDGDRVVVGDWDCDGVVTPALLRPATGDVFVFPRWSPDSELAVAPIRTVPDAEGLEVVPGQDGCAGLQVRTRTGQTAIIIRAVGS